MNPNPSAKTVLCFGDSNTYGTKPDRSGRYEAHQRWTGILQQQLGEDYYVIEEGLGGRTTDLDHFNPQKPSRNGFEYFKACLDSHAPLDIVIIMLGTNDLKTVYDRSARDVAQALKQYPEYVRAFYESQKLQAPKIIIAVIVCFASAFTYLALRWHDSTNTPANYATPLSHHQIEDTKETLLTLLSEQNPKAGFDYLRQAIKDNPSLARECHPLLHHLGHAAYKKYKDFDTTISYQDYLCNSGYTHGSIEAHFAASKDIAKTLKTTCTSSKKLTFEQWQCFHGIGHGVMYYTNKDVQESIKLCESLPENAKKSCINGLFMERFIIISHTGAADTHAEHIDASICEEQPDTYKPDCYVYAPTAFLSLHPNDYMGAFEQCTSVETDYITTCIYGVGGQIMKENILDPSVAKETCRNAPQASASACIEGAVGILINHYADTAPVKGLCSTLFSDYQSTCERKISAWEASYRL